MLAEEDGMGSYQRLLILCTAFVAIAGCSTSAFRTGSSASIPAPKAPEKPGSGPVVGTPEPVPGPGAEPSIEVPRLRRCRASGPRSRRPHWVQPARRS
jgi:hypothetical protein